MQEVKYYIDTLVKELEINNVNSNNPTYISIDDSFETIVKSRNNFITSVGLHMSVEDQNLPCLYWSPKLHKSPYKHRFIAGSSKCTTKDLPCLLTKQGGHKPGKHGKPGKLREFKKLSTSQGKLREI